MAGFGLVIVKLVAQLVGVVLSSRWELYVRG